MDYKDVMAIVGGLVQFGAQTPEKKAYNRALADVIEKIRNDDTKTDRDLEGMFRDHGRWVYNKDTGFTECSVCRHNAVTVVGMKDKIQYFSDYCPSCGSKMDGELYE